MNRIATTLTTLTASVLLGQSLGAAEPTLQTLDSRLGTLESRLIAIEKALTGGNSNYSYTDAATLEATKGSAPAPSAPAAPAATAPAATTASQTYVIQDGDTLGKIATKFGIERKALLEANRLSEGQPIYIGETLMVPGAVAPAAPAAPATTDQKIAKTDAPIPAPPVPGGNSADANKPAPAKQDSIVVGETKKTAPASTKLHTVVKGDTLTSLSKKYNTTVESLKTANGLRSDSISLGQSLKIPTVKAAEQASNTTPAPAPAPKAEQGNSFQYDNPLLKQDETYGYYTVVKNDNLYAIARDFFTTMAELQRINNMGSSTVIRPGDDIIVPTSKYNAYHKEGEVAANR
ncbi:MAG: LysM peptidoglycan-binding domain-containing protein [Verrucomicrobiales bacterium]|nr:LysM peptidoglycan-binding domain-containing protein [Verrucomicrobiales bacterium]